MIRFLYPTFLWLLAFLPLIAILRGRRGEVAAVKYSSADIARHVARETRSRTGRCQLPLTLLALALLIIGLARPQFGRSTTTVEASGVDMILAMDCSGSMEAFDFKIDGQPMSRLDIVKSVVSKFIDARPNDRIGLIGFAGAPYLVNPITLDHDWLQQNLERVKIGSVEDGTAIGSALATSVNRLRDQPSKSKIVVLLTDGQKLRDEDGNEEDAPSGSSRDRFRTAQSEAKKAIELAPWFVESYRLLAYAANVTGEELAATVAQLKKAQAYAPGRQDLRLDLARLSIRMEDYTGARRLLEPISSQSSEPRIKQEAELLLARLQNFEEQRSLVETARQQNLATQESVSEETRSTSEVSEAPVMRRQKPTAAPSSMRASRRDVIGNCISRRGGLIHRLRGWTLGPARGLSGPLEVPLSGCWMRRLRTHGAATSSRSWRRGSASDRTDERWNAAGRWSNGCNSFTGSG
jgi:FimV-like protein